MEKAVNQVLESMSPGNSLRLSKEIVKNELSSWIIAIEDDEEKGQVEEYVMNEGGADSVSEMITDNVFEYLARSSGTVDDDEHESILRGEGAAFDNITSVHVSASSSSGSSESDSRLTVEKGAGVGKDDDDESELGFFRLAEETTQDFIDYGRQSPAIGGDDADEVNLGEGADPPYGAERDALNYGDDGEVLSARDAEESEESEKEEEEVDIDVTPGPTFLAAASRGGILVQEEAGGSVSISLNTLECLNATNGSSSSSDYVSMSSSDESEAGEAPMQSLTPQDMARLEEEERWLEQAIEERIAFLKR